MARKSSGLGLIVAGVTGAVVGAAGSIAAMFFSQEKNRQKVGKSLVSLENKGKKTLKVLEARSRRIVAKKRR